MQLVPIITIEEVELALVSMHFAWQTEELARLQKQLTPLESAFAAFEQRVAAQSGHLSSERDRLRAMCAEMEMYTARIHARLAADPDGHLNAVFSPEELRRIGELCGVDVPDSWFGEELRATTSGEGWYATDANREEFPVESGNSATTANIDDLRTLYRELARAFHPDLSSDERERAFRQEIMLRINHAWHLRDLAGLRDIRNDVSDLLNGTLKSGTSYRLAWYKREISRLESECQICRDRIATLRSGKTVALWHNPSLASSAIARHIARLSREIETLQQRRDQVLDEFRLALGAYASTR